MGVGIVLQEKFWEQRFSYNSDLASSEQGGKIV